MPDIRPSQRPVIYVAGPLKPIDKIGRTQKVNIKIANDVGRGLYELVGDKADILIPHNFHTPLGDCIKSLSAEYFYSLDLGMLYAFIVSGRDLCIYLMRDWKMSMGAMIEAGFIDKVLANKLYPIGSSIKIATSKIDVKEWLQELGVL